VGKNVICIHSGQCLIPCIDAGMRFGICKNGICDCTPKG
uniref:Toxin BmK NSPK n=1 Tax=Olivierus martensii TaxID=34649 RepID=KAX3V_OLIMR|nr:RecName: Full=Toxin BmK NSPK; AltName: Full=Buthus martensii Karsch neurite-stimulating peptide targeting Kv channels [Mesobuthus martensii]